MAGEAEEADIPEWARALAADVRYLRDTLEEWQPIIHALLDPAASGPLSWSVRRKIAKQGGPSA